MDDAFCWYKHQKNQTESGFALFISEEYFRKIRESYQSDPP